MEKGVVADIPTILKLQNIPDFVIDIFNTLLINKFAFGKAIISDVEVKKMIKESTLFDGNIPEYWYDVSAIYELEGWNVQSHIPSCSSIRFYEFTKKIKK